jgi:G:T-mismatch repair DNA endonuclease (very short patch repair protein)
MDSESILAELAREQWGVFSRAQVLAAGISRSGLQRRLVSGDWVEVTRRVYRYRGGNDSWNQRIRSATLSLGPTALASHRAAAFLWGLDALERGTPATLDVTVSRSVDSTVPGIVIHQTRRMPRTPGRRSNIPVTPVARTLLDLAGILDERSLELALDSAIRLYNATLIGVGQELAAVGARHPGKTMLTELCKVRTLGFTDSILEADTNRELRLFGFPLPKTRHNICDNAGTFVARADFAWPELKIVLFFDSHLWHRSGPAFEKDSRQRTRLQALGWRVLQITRATLNDGSCFANLQLVIEAQRQLMGHSDAALRPADARLRSD